MVNCSYCKAEIKRLVFCNPSHKVLYHRKKNVNSPKEAIEIYLEEKKLENNKHQVTTIKKPSIPELRKIIVETEQKYSPHDFGPTGTGVCFKCNPPHKKDVVK